LPKLCIFQLRDRFELFEEKQFDLSQCIGVNFDNTPIFKHHMIDLGSGVTINISVEIEQNKLFDHISDGDLSWSDM
jgi:hypothetical protein